MPAFTGRNVAKFVAKSIVHGQAQSITEDAIVDHTNFEEDSYPVHLGGHLVGWYVSEKFKPLTDRIVDSTADRIAIARANRAAKKNPE